MIRDYKQGDLKSGFVGVRVAISVGSKVKQKWYSNSKFALPTAMALAKEQEQEWLKMQLEYKRNDVKSTRSNTGIKSLSFTYGTTKRASGKRYSYPSIAFQYMEGGVLAHGAWQLDADLNISTELWQKICLHVKAGRTLNDETYQLVLKMKPNAHKHFTA